MSNLQKWWISSLGASVALISIFTIFASCAPGQENAERHWRQIAKPYAFSFATWELQALCSPSQETFGQKGKAVEETRLRKQIMTVLRDRGISVFLPILFRFTKPPHLLVISPRDKILCLDRILLGQDMSETEMENLETRIDALGVSSLVVDLGGFGAVYPAIVGDITDMSDAIPMIVEEWFHQYLACKPLGFLYLLDSTGIRRSQDIVTMNETLADMVSKEISSEVWAKYYPGKESVKLESRVSGFNFDAEMRETREKVDLYLSQGNVAEAERYVEERRKTFVEHGYHIRKLNQAYFAFHGVYAHDPASVSPIYEDLKQLRSKSPSIRSFIDSVAAMRSYADLREALGN